jgi:Uma2 family endonuclease
MAVWSARALPTRFGSTSSLTAAENCAESATMLSPQTTVTLRAPAGRGTAAATRHGYAAARPQAEDILLLIQVADTSSGYDRGVKLPRYAAAGVREVWLVDLNTDRVLVFRGPRAGGYQDVQIVAAHDTLIAHDLPHLRLPVAAIL